jgi:hypothetical protein
MSATYTKLKSGDWGVRFESPNKPQVGSTITAQTKDGTVKAETIERVLWSGPDSKTGKQIHLCAIRKSERRSSSSRDSDMVRCRHCGKKTPEGDDWCMVCGRAGYE